MKINKRREELKESIREAKRVCRKAYRLHKYGTKGTKNENDRKLKHAFDKQSKYNKSIKNANSSL